MTTATQTKPETVTFISKCVNLRLTLEPALTRKDPTTGLTIEDVQGVHAQFQGNEFTTDDPRVIAALRNHRLYNVPVHNGFWSLSDPPDAPTPTTKSQLQAITRALVAEDRDAIEAVVAEERKTHNRALVLDQALEALDATDEAARPDPLTDPHKADEPREQNA